MDTSITMAWCFLDEATAFTRAVLDRVGDTGALVPVIWPFEVANTLLVGQRRRRLTEAQATSFVHHLQALPITVDDGALAAPWGAVLALGRHYGLSAYDATYLELALRQGLPLATLDAQLRAAATQAGVPLVQ
ncbi:MAG: type II toxin-antitoxin system VapC family toxin [Chloroflexota bacterium]